MNFPHERSADDADGFDFEAIPTIDSEPGTPREEALRGNLTKLRWRKPNLTFEEERSLLRRAKAGDAAAKNKLVVSFHKLVLSITKQYHGPEIDNLIAAGLLGLTTAIDKFNLGSNSRLAALAKPEIQYRILDEVAAWKRQGRAGATRADRYLDLHPSAAPVDVAAAVDCSPATAADAVERGEAWSDSRSYDDRLHSLTRAFNRGPNPLARKVDRVVDYAVVLTDRRARLRLDEIGRRAYAELVEHDRKRIEARAEATQYLATVAVRQLRAEAEQLRLERSWKLLSASASQLRRLRKQSEAARPTRGSPEWRQWQRSLLAAWHTEVRANVYQKEDQRALEDARARQGLQKKPPRTRKPRIRVWHQEHEPLLAAE